MPPNADEDCILEKQKNDACERSRLFRARIASREIIFRVNLRETCEKHIEEWFSIGFERFLERYNFVECGLRFLFFLNRSILIQSSPTHAAIIPIFSKNKIARRVPVSVTIRSEKKTKRKTHSASSLHRLGHDLKCFFVVCVCKA